PSMFRLDDRNVAFLSKPFSPTQLLAKVQELVQRSSPVLLPRVAAESPVPTRTVLVVDDDASTVELYARMLTIEGFSVVITTTAERGLREIANRPADAILLDLRMPNVDGVEFLRRLHRAGSRRIPVAILTGEYFVDDQTVALVQSLGAEMHFKPLWV